MVYIDIDWVYDMNKRRYYTGKFIPINRNKYLGDVNNIVWRSSWERTVFKWCDNNPNIEYWNSEEIVIPYISPIDNKQHRYFVDLFIIFKNGNRILVEIKPKNQTVKPVHKKGKRMKTIINEETTYAINIAKWNSANEFANKINAKFVIFSEDTIKNLR